LARAQNRQNMLTAKDKFLRRQKRVRNKIFGTASIPRLSVKKSSRYLYSTVVDDTRGVSLFGATSASKEFKEQTSKKNCAAAERFGAFVGQKLMEKGIKKIVFDRRGYKYHGVLKRFAEALRKSGVVF